MVRPYPDQRQPETTAAAELLTRLENYRRNRAACPGESDRLLFDMLIQEAERDLARTRGATAPAFSPFVAGPACR